MIIKTLELIGFGKFKNKSIELKEGINIVYGQNEDGKTTIHNFIDGMFYGFLKPNVKSTIYSEEHKKYEPWNSHRYAGVINIKVDEENYRIERNFTKCKEETKVFVENTGEDITNSINTGDKGRVLQPGLHFLGLNNGVYSNTVSIKQLGTKTDDNLANELRDKLVNFSTALDDKISVENAIRDLDKSIKEIGTTKAPTSIYGIAFNNINELREEKEEALKFKEEYDNLLDSNNDLDNKLNNLKNLLKEQKEYLELFLLQEISFKYKEASETSELIKQLELNLDLYREFKDLSNEDYSQAVNISGDINILSSKLEDHLVQIDDIEEQIKGVYLNKINFNKKKFDDLSRDYFSFDNLEEEKNKLLYGHDNSSLEFLKRDYKETFKSNAQFTIVLSVFFILYLVGMYFSISRIDLLLIFLAQILLIPISYFIMKLRRIKSLLSRTNQQIFETENDILARKKFLYDVELEQKSILNGYDVLSKQELRSLYESMQQSKFVNDEQLNSLEMNKDKLSLLNNKIKELNRSRQELTNSLEAILSNNRINNLVDFEDGLKKKNLYEDIEIEYSNKKELLKQVLGNSTLEALKSKLDDGNKSLNMIVLEDKDIIQEKINSLIDKISIAKLEKRGVEERINYLTPIVSRLVDIVEEISRNLKIISSLDNKRKALELAKSTIEKLSKDIHNQFAPEINDKVGEIVNKITGGKYCGVRINNKLDIGVIHPITGEIINISSLSGGTIDQLYFSLRFGIINSITKDSLPLILDDCFIQYDDNRLRNILQLLSDISKDRQIILFSCHNREKDMLRNMGESFNLITLT